MKAVVYQGPFSVAVEEVPDPELKHPNDVIFTAIKTLRAWAKHPVRCSRRHWTVKWS